mgnify:CR=1 FL=1
MEKRKKQNEKKMEKTKWKNKLEKQNKKMEKTRWKKKMEKQKGKKQIEKKMERQN